MSDESEVDKVLRNAPELKKALGENRALVAILFGIWAVRNRTGWAVTAVRAVAVLLGLAGYRYGPVFFS